VVVRWGSFRDSPHHLLCCFLGILAIYHQVVVVVVIEGDEVVVGCWCYGGEVWDVDVVMWWCWILTWCVVNVVSVWFSWYLTLWPLSNVLRFAELSLWVSVGVQICWDLQVFCIWLIFTLSVSTVLFGGGLRAETYLSRFPFYRCSTHFGSRSCLLDFDRPITFDSRSRVSV
jgi:hypothetical protein